MSQYLKMRMPHPFEPREFDGYGWPVRLHFDLVDLSARVVWGFSETVEAAEVRSKPLVEMAVTVPREGVPAVYGDPPLITPGSSAVYAPDPETGELVLVTPAVDPVYGPAPLLVPALPPFATLLAAGQEAYNAIGEQCYAVSLTRPEFAGAEVVQI
jgi:hypothetical protein